MNQKLKQILHLSNVQNHKELTQVLLSHFSHATTISAGKYKYQKPETEHYMIISMNQLDKIENIEVSDNFSKEELTIISSTIQTKLVDNQTIKVGQIVGFSDEKITSHFRYKDEFQILPISPNAPQMPQSYGDHPFLIQFKYVSSPDFTLDNPRRARRANELARILNAILVQSISLGPRCMEQYWVFEGGVENLTSRWAQRGYTGDKNPAFLDDFTDITNKQPFDLLEPDTYYKSFGSSSEPLKLPTNISETLDKVFSLFLADHKKFIQACSWYAASKELWLKSHASYYIALVCAIESLISESQKCPDCNQEFEEPIGGYCKNDHPKYMITRRFKNFVQRYAMLSDPLPKEIEVIYTVRSKLVHGSLFFDGDLESFGLPLSFGTDSERDLFTVLNKITRLILYNWLHLKNTTT